MDQVLLVVWDADWGDGYDVIGWTNDLEAAKAERDRLSTSGERKGGQYSILAVGKLLTLA